MKDCESSYSSWKFSGGFRTWVKMSLVKTKEEDGSETVEFKQEVKKPQNVLIMFWEFGFCFTASITPLGTEQFWL